jgi:hypothetical protein
MSLIASTRTKETCHPERSALYASRILWQGEGSQRIARQPVNDVRAFLIAHYPAPASGTVNRNRVPAPFRKGLSHASVPPISAILLATIESPKPVPVGFVVK